jgi:hypothetical protein
VGTKCSLEVQQNDKTGNGGKARWQPWTRIFPEDINRRQSFNLLGEAIPDGVHGLRLMFEESSDFFGRITVYDLQIIGHVVS